VVSWYPDPKEKEEEKNTIGSCLAFLVGFPVSEAGSELLTVAPHFNLSLTQQAKSTGGHKNRQKIKYFYPYKLLLSSQEYRWDPGSGKN
jgi:hypothetical protein